MSKAYESLTSVGEETLSGSKATCVDRPKPGDGSGLDRKLEDLQKEVGDWIGTMKAAVKDQGSTVSRKGQGAVENLRANIAVLDAKLSETQDRLREKDSASQKMEETLTAKINGLQNDLRKKETALHQANAKAVSQAKRADQLIESLKARIAPLEAKLTEAEEIVREKDLTATALQQGFTDTIHDLESQLRKSEEVAAYRERQVSDLTSKLKVLKNEIKGMSSFFKEAEEVLAAVEAPDTGTRLPAGDLPKPIEEDKSANFHSNGVPVVAQATVPAKFFDRMTVALSNALGPIASILLRDHVASLSESSERFPKARVIELVEVVSQEAPDEILNSVSARY
jgi:chromosome segregation ATPase